MTPMLTRWKASPTKCGLVRSQQFMACRARFATSPQAYVAFRAVAISSALDH